MTKELLTVGVHFPVKKVDDLLCSAIEGSGAAYWAEISGQVHSATVKKYIPKSAYLYPMHGGALFVKDIEADRGKTYELNRESVMTGLQAMAQNEPQHFADFMTGDDDMTTADVFLQCALFGKVKYS